MRLGRERPLLLSCNHYSFVYISTLFFSIYVQVDDGGSMKDEVRQD